MGDYITIADIRKHTGLALHVINHALRRHGPEPTDRVGIIRVWPRAALPQIEEALRRTGERSTRPERRLQEVSLP